jgi:hypothetical protein
MEELIVPKVTTKCTVHATLQMPLWCNKIASTIRLLAMMLMLDVMYLR